MVDYHNNLHGLPLVIERMLSTGDHKMTGLSVLQKYLFKIKILTASYTIQKITFVVKVKSCMTLRQSGVIM